MRRLIYVLAGAALAIVLCVAVFAQRTVQTSIGDGGSPHVRSEWTVQGAHITVEYGRPSLKGREVGAQVAQYGEPWRTGADQASTIMSEKPIKFGKISLAAGTTYTINTLPGKDGWQLMIGKLAERGQWGIPYMPDLEMGRVPMNVSTSVASAEQVTILINPAPNGGTLIVEWGNVSAEAPFTIG